MNAHTPPAEAALLEQSLHRTEEKDAYTESDAAAQDDDPPLQVLDDWFEQSWTWMQPQRTRWEKNHKLKRPTEMDDPPNTITTYKAGIPLAVVETEMAIVGDFLPTVNVMPQESDDQEYADQMQHRTREVLDEACFKERIMDACRRSLYDSDAFVGIAPVLDDKEALQEVRIELYDNMSVFLEPHALGINILRGEARYVIFAYPMHVDEIQRIYGITVPGEGKITEHRTLTKQETGEGENTGEYALVKECWYWDKRHFEDDLYPYGRFTVWANKTKIKDFAWQYENPPYYQLGNYSEEGQAFGIGETELLEPTTNIVNYVMSSIADNIVINGNPSRWFTPDFKQENRGGFTGRPNESYVVTKEGQFGYINPPQIPNYTFAYVELTLKLGDIVSGIHDVIEGKKGSAQIAAETVARLQEAAQARVRLKVTKEINPFVQKIGKLVLEIIQKHDMEARNIRTSMESGAMQFVPYDPQAMSGKQFDVVVQPGVGFLDNYAYREERAINLMKIGAFDMEEGIKHLQVENKAELIDRLKARDMVIGRIDALKQAQPDFEQLAGLAMQYQDRFAHTAEEDDLAALILQNPEFIMYDAFKNLPMAIKQRIIEAMVIQTAPANPSVQLLGKEQAA